MRFVLVSFVFLFWAFYELSGGEDFVPRGVRPPKPEPVAAVTDEPAAAPAGPVEAASLVAKPAIAPRKPRPTAPAAIADRGDSVQVPAAEPTAPRVRASLSDGLTLFPVTQPSDQVSFAAVDGSAVSLGEIAASSASVTPANLPARAATPTEPPRDMREVSGTRVNLRDGPGTVYPVIARLRIGQKVEVLGESGTGWLRLRTEENGLNGWVAASLISKPR